MLSCFTIFRYLSITCNSFIAGFVCTFSNVLCGFMCNNKSSNKSKISEDQTLFSTKGNFHGNIKDLQSVTFLGTTRESLVPNPLTVTSLNYQLYIFLSIICNYFFCEHLLNSGKRICERKALLMSAHTFFSG